MNKNNVLASIEAMLFAAGDPVEPSKLAEVLDIDVENVTKLSKVMNDISNIKYIKNVVRVIK